jgi:C4-dicarboxylate transporter DctQ subunit
MMIWTVLIGAAIGARTGARVGAEAFVNLFPVRPVKFAFPPTGVISLGFSLFLTTCGVVLARRVIGAGQVSPAMEIPMWLVHAAVPVGSALTAGHFLFAGIDKYRGFKGKEA